MLHNFNASTSEVEEFAYIEILDCLGLNLAKKSTEFKQFFDTFLLNSKIVSNANSAMPKGISIKHEYFSEMETALSKRGLFSLEKIMSFVFVFDYNSDETFIDVVDYGSKLSRSQSNKMKKESQPHLFFFCNKYDDLVFDDEPELIKNDEKYLYYIEKLKRIYKTEEEASKYLFYVSAKYNSFVSLAFSSVINSINKDCDLWNTVQYESNHKLLTNVDINVIKVTQDASEGFFERISSCCGSRSKLKETANIQLINDISYDTSYDKNEDLDEIRNDTRNRHDDLTSNQGCQMF